MFSRKNSDPIRYRNKLEKLRADLQKYQSEISAIGQHYNQAINGLPQAQKKLADFIKDPVVATPKDCRGVKLMVENSEYKRIIQDMTSKVEMLQELHKQIVPEYQRLDGLIKETRTEITKLEKNPPKVAISHLKSAFKTLETKKADLERLQSALGAQEPTDIDELKAAVKAKSSAVDVIAADVSLGDASAADLTNARKELTAAEKAYQAALSKNADSETIKRGISRKIEQLDGEVNDAQADLQTLVQLFIESQANEYFSEIETHLKSIRNCVEKLAQNDMVSFEFNGPAFCSQLEVKSSGLVLEDDSLIKIDGDYILQTSPGSVIEDFMGSLKG